MIFATADRYILRQIAAPLAAAMSIGLLVLLAERMVRLLDTTLGKKNSFAVVFELLAYLVPHYLGLAIPAALFLGLLFGFSRLSKDSEIDAFNAAGIGLARLARPVILLSILIGLASLAIFGWVQPQTRFAYRSVLFDVKNVDVFYLAEEGVFMQAGTRTFILDELDRSANAFDRIFLFDYRGAGGAQTVTATRGTLVEVPGQRRPVLELENGHRLTLDKWPDPASAAPPPAASAASFEKAETPLGKETARAFHPRGEDERELTLPELWSMLDDPPKDTTREAMRAELHKRLVSAAVPLILPFLALPFAMGRKRARRAYQFGVALVVLIALHETVEQGAILARSGGVSPWLAIWPQFLAVAAFALWRFRRVCFTMRSGRLDDWLDRLADGAGAVFGGLFRRRAEPRP